MILRLWNNLRGYVIIEVHGFSVERFVNMATHRGVYIWDMEYNGAAVRMKVSAKAFKLLRGCAKKTGCKIKICSKHGAAFVAFRYRKRRILAFGALFFVAAMYFLASFVWLVDVEGCRRVNKEDVYRFAENAGLTAGEFKARIDTEALEDQMIAAFPEISWVDIHLQGTRATIKIAETIPEQEMVDRESPCDIVAKKDGLVVSIATSAGTPMVKENDVVKKGDVLVGGEIVVKEDETGAVKRFVRARAEVWGKMYDEIVLDVEYNYEEKLYTGEIKKGYSISVFDKNINLIKASKSFENYDKIISRKQLNFGENYPLPIILITEELRAFEPISKVRTEEQAKTLAEKMVTARILREFDFEADIYDKELEFYPDTDKLRVKAMVTSLERIDQVSELEIWPGADENSDTETITKEMPN